MSLNLDQIFSLSLLLFELDKTFISINNIGKSYLILRIVCRERDGPRKYKLDASDGNLKLKFMQQCVGLTLYFLHHFASGELIYLYS